MYNDIKKRLLSQAYLSKTPILGEFELTKACNFRCKMCYLTNHVSNDDLSTSEWKLLFKEAVNEGLLFALLTGGEVFTRPDFKELYNYLYDLGVKITIFTNGSMITDDIIMLFQKRPPEMITITLYGATNSTYAKITKNPNGFELVNQGIDLLLKNNINVSLRTLPLYPIYQELDKMIEYVKSKKLILNYILYLTPSELDRLNSKDLVVFERKIQKAFSLKKNELLNKSKKETNCGALHHSYYVNSVGEMKVCALAYKPVMKIKGIKDTFEQMREQYSILNKQNVCKSCNDVSKCPTCYARRLYDSKEGCNVYLKEYVHEKE